MRKLIFVDDVYQAYLKDKEALKHPENQIYLAPPRYFLPTWDPGMYSTLRCKCSLLVVKHVWNVEMITSMKL